MSFILRTISEAETLFWVYILLSMKEHAVSKCVQVYLCNCDFHMPVASDQNDISPENLCENNEISGTLVVYSWTWQTTRVRGTLDVLHYCSATQDNSSPETSRRPASTPRGCIPSLQEVHFLLLCTRFIANLCKFSIFIKDIFCF